LTMLLTALISHWVTATCLPIWRTGSDHSTSTVSWWRVSVHGWAHRRQTSLTQACKNLFPNMTSASISGMTALRCSLSMYVSFVYNKLFFSMLLLLTAHWKLLSE
jgi:hypothetical protein